MAKGEPVNMPMPLVKDLVVNKAEGKKRNVRKYYRRKK